MTIRSRTASLDDASGDLALSLAKLELEAAHGTPNTDEQIDFVRDLSRVADQKRIRPWRLRALQAGALGLASLAGAVLLPSRLAWATETAQPAAFGLSLLFVILAGVCLAIYLQRRREEHRWLRRMEQAVQMGRSVLDEP